MRTWRTGTVTAGVLLIVTGLLWFLQNFISIPFEKLLLNAWPVACILLGVEILAFHVLRKDGTLRFHWASVVLLVFVMVVSLGFNFVNVVLNELGIQFHTSEVAIHDTKKVPDTIKEIVIDVPRGDVTVRGAESNKLVVTGSIMVPAGDEKEAEEKLLKFYSVKILGDKMYVQVKQKYAEFIDFTDSDALLDIEVPKFLETKTIVNNGSIELKNMENTAALQLDNGNIQVENFAGTLQGSIGNGMITIEEAALQGNSNLTTNNGAILLGLKINQHLKIYAEGFNGDINGNIPWVKQTQEGMNVGEVVLGDGTNQLIMKANGEITVNQ
ncbi:DUF5668 domain-containing protein [Bacillus sp. 165]|uniref:LiaI-LiaF-like domain-containing protein n=1 Tax=Bacillus sp. 165 TaxID=1529117 RepID=UPI001ADA7220|nr:DUF5668 domain-containing protein [Bacillus sp. 165]MBO9128978.1 hypothetical protein [Bacillus sp. 165]